MARAVEWRQKARSRQKGHAFRPGGVENACAAGVQINPLHVARGTMSEAEALALLHELAREMAELVLR